MAVAGLVTTLLLLGPTSSAVEWNAPAACPDAGAVTETVERYVRRPLLAEGEPIEASGVVTGPPEGPFTLALRLGAPDGTTEERTLSDRDCAVLADAAALMIAVALDPEVVLPTPESPATDEAPPPQKPEPRPESKPAPQPRKQPPPTPKPAAARPDCLPGPTLLKRPAAERNRLRPTCGAVGAMFGLLIGPLPSLAPGVGGYLAALWPRLRLELGASHWFEQSARGDADEAIGADLRLTVADLGACYRLGFRRAGFGFCGRGTIGVMRGIGVGIVNPREDRLFWSTLGLGVRAGWSPVRRLGMFARATVWAPIRTTRFSVGGVGVVHEPSLIGFSALAGAEVRFP